MRSEFNFDNAKASPGFGKKKEGGKSTLKINYGWLNCCSAVFSISEMATLACEQRPPIVLSQNFRLIIHSVLHTHLSHGEDDANGMNIRKRFVHQERDAALGMIIHKENKTQD